jgi:cytochrome d ubiquinol oxidase subunit I
VDWSRGQFALTAMYHWLFVPLTLGLSFLVAFTETLYVKTGDVEWKRITKFWMTLFGINFAIGVATGIILEFEFGTNWSNYSWFVGDIFGAPLAIEGILAFFLESTFIAVMFFGWNKVSKRFHLISTWLVAFGANLSALWILVANGWMNSPTGTVFNPDTARNEMINFWDVFLSPFAVQKFLHTISSGFITGSMFVIGVSAWLLLKNRHIIFAKRSIVVAAVFGIISTLFTIFTGDSSGNQVAQKQPMKLAAMESLYKGTENAGLVTIGMLTCDKKVNDGKDPFVFRQEIPGALSFLSFRNFDSFVPGIEDLINGNPKYGIIPMQEKIDKGVLAINALGVYKNAKKTGDSLTANAASITLKENWKYFGYGYLTSPEQLIPNVPMTFYSFRIMVGLGFLFLFIFVISLWLVIKKPIEKYKWFLRLSVLAVPLTYLAGQAGWIVAEMGRQPWVVQDLLPVSAAVSRIEVGAVQTTFVLFAVIFTALLIAELRIMFKQIKIGPKTNDGGND